ncbi:twitching motility protein PilT [Deltaproteobacteria bacterium]|nr:twitching motility protein PilT [Deltaproteobacteria bacterium]
MDVQELLAQVLAAGGSDLHLVAGVAPSMRVHGDIKALPVPALDGPTCDQLVRSLLQHHQLEALDRDWQVSVSVEVDDPRTNTLLGHFRVSVHLREGVAEAAIRVTPRRTRSPDELGLPQVLKELALRDSGLILITGPTGQGKTTTFNALVDYINQRKRVKVITIEDPIEYRHQHRQAVIVQLEVGRDTRSFAEALRHALREDPDVICVGEMRDLETIATALTAAETGHLVLATLHTPSAVGTISRIIDVFPGAQQDQVKVQLANTLTAVIAQRLLPRADGRGRVLATEVLIATDAVRNLIREQKLHQMHNVMATSRALGMQRLEDHLRLLLEQGTVSRSVAAMAANDVRAIADLL